VKQIAHQFGPNTDFTRCGAKPFKAQLLPSYHLSIGVAPHPFNHAQMIADELFWWSEGREGVKLLQAYEQWAAGFGAVVRMTTLEAVNPDRMTRFFARRGYQPLERAFVKVG
jgi:hypothetical protein